MAHRVDYDQIAATYDARYSGSSYEKVLAAIRGLALATAPERTLEVGCGTGYWLSALHDLLPHAYGLDFSLNMLRKARRSTTGVIRGTAEALPFRSATFDLIFCLNAIHHFPRLNSFVQETRRLLRPGGTLAVIGMDPHHGRDRWCVYDYFPETKSIDLARFPSSGTVADTMLAAGFDRVECSIACSIAETRIGRAVLDDPELQRHGCSQMTLLTDDQYAAGIGRIKAALEESREPPKFKVDIAFMLCRGTVAR